MLLVFNDPPVFPGRIDPSDRFRERRRRTRRRRQIRSLAILAVLVGAVVALALNAKLFTGGGSGAESQAGATTAAETEQAPSAKPAGPPKEIRGVHLTAALASVPGKLGEYLKLRRHGLNTLQLDIKDENGEVAFRSRAVPLAGAVGAAQRYYDPAAVAKRARRRHLPGRTAWSSSRIHGSSEARPGLAIRTRDGSVWRNSGGLGWTNPYDQRVWKYNVDIAVAAARAGFDEIMFDYVRFPSDGDVDGAVYAGRGRSPAGRPSRLRGVRDEPSEARSASRCRRPSSALPRPVTSASDSARGFSPSTSTPSTRWCTPPTSGPGSTTSPTPRPPRDEP